MKLSYAITVHNEGEYLAKLLMQLQDQITKINPQDEIIILDDFSTDPKTVEILEAAKKSTCIRVFQKKFDGDFSAHKNYLNKLCDGEFILQLDADELVSDYLLTHIHMVFESNPRTDLFLVPRINIVDGLTIAHVEKWRWNISQLPSLIEETTLTSTMPFYQLLQKYNLIVSSNGDIVKHYIPIIQWPDYQTRLYRNSFEIQWHNKVHERISGHKIWSALPEQPEFSLIHRKTIDRQEQQNALYAQL